MSGYVGKVQIGPNSNNQIAFGDILYGTCRTAAATAAKVLENNVTVNNSTWNDFPVGFGQLMDGIQVRIKFIYGNTVTSGVTLKILGTNALPVEGDCRCNSNEVIIFTFEENVGGQSHWRVTGGGISSSIQQYISNAVGQMAGTVDSMVFKGTIGTSGATVSSLPSSDYKAGWTYKAISNDATNNYGLSTTTGNGQGRVEAGDLIIAIADASSGQSTFQQNHWTVVQTNIDGAVTGPAPVSGEILNNKVAVFDGETGKIIKDSGFTIETSVPANAVFTDTDTNTTYQYTITAPTANTYNGIDDDYDSSSATSTELVSISNGVLHLKEGITFTTTAAVTSATLNQSSVAGPSLT